MKARTLWTLGALLILALIIIPIRSSHAEDIAVDTTGDVLDAAANCGALNLASLPGPDGVTSLREAICAANNNPGPDTISFAIPAAADTGCDAGSGACTIQPTIALPTLSGGFTTVDGYSQDGAVPATESTPATIVIQIDGSGVANNNGFNITSAGNLIQGLAINRFSWNGVAIGGGGAINNVIAGNHIGLDPGGTVDLGNGFDGVFIGLGAQNNLVGGDEAAERNVIAGNEYEGVAIHGDGTMGNAVSGNYIGLMADGWTARGNTLFGVRIYGGAQNNVIGGAAAGEGNVISGNGADGVHIAGTPSGATTSDNVVAGNIIGLDATGASAVANSGDGVHIENSQENTVGGDTAGERNVISGNWDDGVEIRDPGAHENIVSGNYIGVDASGATAIPNGSDGVVLIASPANLVGGDTAGERNVIAGNAAAGVSIIYSPAEENVVSGNYIGTSADGLAAIPNGNHGVRLDLGARNSLIGGATAGERNVIAGNGTGVSIGGTFSDFFTMGNTVRGNLIGVAADGVTPLGNDRDGVRVSVDAPDNMIGPDNVIAHNGWNGVAVDTPLAVGNMIVQNSIYDNAELGIDLTNGGNNDRPAPAILSAPAGPGAITGAALPGSIVELFASRDAEGEGEIFLGTTTANGAGDFTFTVSTFLPYPHLTATSTDAADGTSEFSPVYTAAIPILHAGSSKTVARETAAPGESLAYTITLANTGTGTATAIMTDTLPAGLSWADNASATSGVLTWESAYDRLLWSGSVAVGGTVVIDFAVRLDAGLSNGETIANTAMVDDGAGHSFALPAPEVTVEARGLFLPLVVR